MKKSFTKIAWMVAGLVLACFCVASTHAQAEVEADNYPRLNTVPITLEAVKVDFQGNFSLARRHFLPAEASPSCHFQQSSPSGCTSPAPIYVRGTAPRS